LEFSRPEQAFSHHCTFLVFFTFYQTSC